MKNLCSVLHRLKSLYLLPMHTPPLLRIWDCLEYLALHTLPIWSANKGTTEQTPTMLCHHMLPPEQELLARLHSALHRQLSNSKHPTHIPAMTENQTSQGLPEAFANQRRFFSCCNLCLTVLLERLWDLPGKILFISQTKQWKYKDTHTQTNTYFAIRR